MMQGKIWAIQFYFGTDPTLAHVSFCQYIPRHRALVESMLEKKDLKKVFFTKDAFSFLSYLIWSWQVYSSDYFCLLKAA